MAERLVSSGARDLDFISDNPAVDAFQHGQKIAREAETTALEQETRRLANDYSRQANPTRLRDLEATTSSNESNAAVARQTVPYKVNDAYNASRSSGANADVAVATVPAHISQANSAASTAATGAQVASQTAPYTIENARSGSRLNAVNADIGEATKDTKIERAKIENRQATASAQNTELQALYKEVELLNQGNIEGAQQVAAAAGHTLPPELINSADARSAITSAAKHAQDLYPNRPRDQLSFIQGFIKDMAERKAKGQNANAPAAAYQVPGAPEPQEDTSRDKFTPLVTQEVDPNDPTKTVTRNWNHSSSTGEVTPITGPTGALTRADRSGSGSGRTSVFQQKQAAWIAVHPGDSQGALDYASGHRQMGDGDIIKASLTMAQREIANNQMLRFKNSAEQAAAVNKRASEIAQQLKAGYAAPAAGAPGAAPMQPPPGLSGNGTQQAPFQAATQDHVNWFKQNAQPGQVIIINGAPFTK